DARRAAVGEVRHLHGRRLAREHEQPVPARMRGEVYEDIDVFSANDVGELVVRKRSDVAPVIGMLAHEAGDRVRGSDVRVRKHLDPTPVVLPEERQNEAGYRMLAKVRGDVADAKATVRLAAVRMRAPRRGQRLHMPLGPIAVLARE